MPSKLVAQPARDTPESIAKDFTDANMSDSHDKDTREGIAANLAHWINLLLREREEEAERRGATERDAEWSRLLGWAKPRTPEAYAVVLAEAATFTDEVRSKLNRLEAAAERRGAEAMRERVADALGRFAQELDRHFPDEGKSMHIAEARARALPLPGDK